MDQAEMEGVRLLSFDGGDIRAVSQLLILDEFMRRIEFERGLNTRILPCDCFHMMGGVGTGGIIVVLLAILRMEIEEAIREFIAIWTSVFADAGLDEVTRSAKLEATIKDLLERRGLPQNRKLYNADGEDRICKAFVCAAPESNLGMCEKLRSYKSKETSINVTIVEAIRATCAIPTLFTPVSIESVGCQVFYVTGSYSFNNPAWEMIKEACEAFRQTQPVACMLSLGCGQRPTVRLSRKNKDKSTDLVQDIASDCERVDRDLAWRIGKSNVYYRLSVDRILETGGDSELGLTEDIMTCTNTFLEHPTTAEKMNECLKTSACYGRVTLKEISGLSETKPTTAYGLPSLSAFFVERPSLIKKMANCLFRVGPPAQRRIILSGLGGIGKTQITISFLNQFLSRFRHVLFIDASSVQRIENGVIAKVKSLGTAYSRTSAGDALEVLANPDHEITRDWAIVYDNVDSRDINIAEYFPRCPFGTIFITTRNHSLGNLARKAHLRLDIMSEDEAANVLLRSAFDPCRLITEDDEKHAREIAKELGYLPVALVQAGYFINIHDCMHDYRERLRKRRPDILSRPAEDQLDPHYHGVYATLNVTWPHLSLRAQNLLSILGFVNYTGFPIILLYRAAERGFLFEPLNLVDRPALFQQTIKLLSSTFRSHEAWDEQDVDDPVSELQKYSLVTPMMTFNVKTLRLHPLVHSWAHDKLSREEKDAYMAAAIRLLVCVTGSDDEDIFDFIYPHITLLSDGLESLHPNDQVGIAAVLAHQRDLKAAIGIWEGMQTKVRELYGRDDLRPGEADLQLARLYWLTEEGEKRDVASVLENEVVDIRKETLGIDHPVTMKAIVQLASGMKRSWKQGEAELLLRDALSFWKKQPGDHWETILQVEEELAGCCNVKEAVSRCTEVLQARMQRNGPDHHATLKAMENLARAYGDPDSIYPKARESSATEAWISAVTARTNKRGIEHPDTLNAMENLARSYWFQDFNKCVAQWRKVIELRKAVQGAYHIDTLNAMEALENVYCSDDGSDAVGDVNWLEIYRRPKVMEEIRKEITYLREEVMCLSKETHGPSHKNTLEAMKQLALMHTGWGKYSQAEEQWQEIVRLTREAQGPNQTDTLDAMKRLAFIYELRRKYPEAEEQWQEIVRLTREAQGPSHKDTLDAMRNLALLYQLWEKHPETEEQWKELVRVTTEARGPSHQYTLGIVGELATIYKVRGKYSEAVALWKEIVCSTMEAHGPNHEATLDTTSRLAQLYESSRKHPEAEEQRKEIIHLTREADRSYHRRTIAAMKALAHICNPWKSYTEAEGQWKDVVCLTREALPTDHEGTLYAMTELANVYEDWDRNATEEEEVRKEIVHINKEARGPNHQRTVSAMRKLAEMYERLGKYKEAALQWEEVLLSEKYVSSTDPWETSPGMQLKGTAMRALARMYEQCGRYTEAAVQWENIIRLEEDCENVYKPDRFRDMKALAIIYERCGRPTQAAAKWEEIVQFTMEAKDLGSDATLDAIGHLSKVPPNAEAYTRWELQAKEDVRLAREKKGPSHEDTIKVMEGLAQQYQAWGKHAESEDQWKEIICLTKDARGYISWSMPLYMRNLAKLYKSRERYTEAIAQLEEILLLEKDAGYRRPFICGVMEFLAEIYAIVGRDEEAAAQRKESIRLMKKEFLDDGKTLEHMESLAGLYERCEQPTQAAAKWEEIVYFTMEAKDLRKHATLDAIAHLAKISPNAEAYTRWELQAKEDVRLAREEKGPSHEDTIKVMEGLAQQYQAWGKHAESEDQWKETIRLTKDAEGRTSWSTLRCMRDQAEMYGRCERHEEAMAQLDEILQLRNDATGMYHPQLIHEVMRSLAEIYKKVGRDEEAIAQLEEILRLEDNATRDQSSIRCDMELLAEIYARVGRHNEATAQGEEIIRLKLNDKNISHLEKIEDMKTLARKYEESGQYTKAVAKREEILQFTKDVTLGWSGLIQDGTLDAISQLAKICDSAKALTELETQMKEGVRLTRETKGPSHKDTIWATEELAQLYQAWGKHSESEDQWKEVVRLEKDVEGPSGRNMLYCMRELAKVYESCERYDEAAAQLEEILRLADGSDPDDYFFITEVDDSLAGIYKRIGGDNEAVAQREQIQQLPKDINSSIGGHGIIQKAENMVDGYERCEEYAKAAALLAEMIQLTKDDKHAMTWKFLEYMKRLVGMYMKLERYEDAEAVLLNARDQVPWERHHVKEFRKLLEEVRSKSAHKETSSTK